MDKEFEFYLNVMLYMAHNNIDNKTIILSQLLQKDKYDGMKKYLVNDNGNIDKDTIKFVVESMDKIAHKLYVTPQKYNGEINNIILRKILSDYKHITLNVVDNTIEKTNDELDGIIAKSNENYYAYAEITNKKVYLKLKCIENPNNIDLFSILHEIGHIETNLSYMWRVEQEYLATQWALDHCDMYGITVSRELLEQQQNYIYSFLTNNKYKNKYKLKYKL